MKTTAKTLVGWITVAIVLSAKVTAAAPLGEYSLVHLATLTMGQAATATPSEDKSMKAADLLRRARQAMDENNLTAADSLVAQAEALDVQYNAFYIGDTPRKVRRDLDRKRATQASPAKPSQLLAPLGLNKTQPVPATDPFAGKAAGSSAPAAQTAQAAPAYPMAPATQATQPGQVLPLPRVDANATRTASAQAAVPGAAKTPDPMMSGQNDIPSLLTLPAKSTITTTPGAVAAVPNPAVRPAAPTTTPAAPNTMPAAGQLSANAQPVGLLPTNNGANAPATNLLPQRSPLQAAAPVGLPATTPAAQPANNTLREARLALAFGDIRRASSLTQQARTVPMNYQPLDDTPDKVDTVIRKYEELQTLDKNSEAFRRGYARSLTEQAEALFRLGERDEAERLAGRAASIPIMYGPLEAKPQDLLQRIAASRRSGNAAAPATGQVVAAAAQAPVAAGIANAAANRYAAAAVYNPTNDPTRNVQASSQQPTSRPAQRTPASAEEVGLPPQVPAEVVTTPAPAGQQPARASAMALVEQGEAALRANDTARAYQLFLQAASQSTELDPVTSQRLQDHLQQLSVAQRGKAQGGQGSSLVDEAAAKQQILQRQVQTELANKVAAAQAMRDKDPNAAIAILEEARKKVEASGVDQNTRDRLVRQIDRSMADAKQVLEQNRPQIELADKSNKTRHDVEREQHNKIVVREKIALKIDEFNRLCDEQRYDEAVIAAKQARDLDPKDPVVQQVVIHANFLRNQMSALAIREQKEEAFMKTLEDVDIASINRGDDKNPMTFGNVKDWNAISRSRKKFQSDNKLQRTEQEIEIDKKLRTPVLITFKQVPLNRVLIDLGKLAEVNLYIDEKGLYDEGVDLESPVTIEMRHEIMLKSALNLILQPLHLSYVIQDETLKITTEQMRDGQLVRKVYNVADLVIPIPNFVPQAMGEASAYKGAMADLGFGGGGLPLGPSMTTPMQVASEGKTSGAITPAVLAQQQLTNLPRPAGGNMSGLPGGAGPGGLGGGAQADFGSLIDLITSTVKPTSWASAGGPAPDPAQFETNLSLVITQTQEVHEQIAELLEQLRRLQDLQVTIEVRFITLNDKFFERIGVSFDFDIGTNTGGKGVSIVSSSNSGVATGAVTSTTARSRAITVGMSSPTTFSSDLDIPFTQNSYSLAVPQFGGYDASAGASLGFAILGDIEAYFFVNAAQGDRRSNVLQAPKVTLFNGQQASVYDITQTPFVMSVIPVVGDFAAASQPVVVVLSEGTSMTVQAVISADRRFVRLTVVPYFSTIGDVTTFTFTGSSTTTNSASSSSLTSSSSNSKSDSNGASTTSTGTTVQLPSFSVVTVMTTVSVPDGGTILLGGIKRLQEGRNEFGVPGLDKIPYVNRLFKNQSIGRETSSLMMMVTPRIIIQEEEEERMGVPSQEP